MTNKISVAMCTYNGARFVAEQMTSIALQTRPPDELVVCDDCSTDATTEIVREFASRAPFPVRLHVNAKNLGSTRNFEQAVRLSAGDIIALSDQDDVWMPEKLERIEARFSARPNLGLVFTDAEIVDEELRPLGYRLWDRVSLGKAERRLLKSGRALDVLLPGWTVTGATAAFRAKFRDLFLEIPDDLPMIHDGWIALIIAAVADVAFIDEPLIKYRQHSRQQIGAPEKNPSEAEGGMSLKSIKAAARRSNVYEELINVASRVRQRLLARCEAYDCQAAVERLESRLTHMRARASLPQHKFRRLGCVARELFARRYHLYSRGFHSALKDILFGGTHHPSA